MKKKIAVIGAGPKAFALLAKNKALESKGFSVPEVTVFEKKNVGSAWDGCGGFTDGKGYIDVSPLKDVTYPNTIFGVEVDQYMKNNFSFYRYISDIGKIADWVNMGYPSVTHEEYVLYLLWLQKLLSPNLLFNEVTKIEPKEKGYILTTNENEYFFDGVVVTGFGGVLKNFDSIGNDLLDSSNYWKQKFRIVNQDIVLIGGGASAATIYEDLVHQNVDSVTWISRRPLYTRSANFSNNQLFSFPEIYRELPLATREEFYRHTDGNTISQRTNLAMQSIKTNFLIGNVECVSSNQVVTQQGVYGGIPIIATGYDRGWFLDILPKYLWPVADDKQASVIVVQNSVNEFLSTDLFPNLHVPMLAGLMQGIGIPTLTCLSRMSDMILSQYVAK
jgi:mycobactin lysine-N-oxygenase